LTSRYGYTLTVYKGFYNIHRQSFLGALFFRLLNSMIRYTGSLGLRISPFLFIKVRL
jgi:hypothetical protein